MNKLNERTLGLSPDPCLRKVPVMNQKLLLMLNWFSITSFSITQGWGLFHSYGENRAITNRVNDTSTYAARTYLNSPMLIVSLSLIITYSQISTANGFMKLNSRVGLPLGILNRIEIPRFIKGFVKSITDSRAKLMVIAPTAMSAFRSISSWKFAGSKMDLCLCPNFIFHTMLLG